ncbi:hypothetical protein [Salinicoccus roseus]|uniref:hypothetical protein n=1 Tax=Salinicoccus roseus TaxID=45670 RepID=UPI002301FB98|nr:hypothetical protein [Salinicoccus roseus]
MRYDKRADLYFAKGERYDPKLGKNVTDYVVLQLNVPCAHMPMSIEKVKTTFGEVDRDINIVHFNEKVPAFTHLTIKGKSYKVQKLVPHRRSVAYVEEVSPWN